MQEHPPAHARSPAPPVRGHWQARGLAVRRKGTRPRSRRRPGRLATCSRRGATGSAGRPAAAAPPRPGRRTCGGRRCGDERRRGGLGVGEFRWMRMGRKRREREGIDRSTRNSLCPRRPTRPSRPLKARSSAARLQIPRRRRSNCAPPSASLRQLMTEVEAKTAETKRL